MILPAASIAGANTIAPDAVSIAINLAAPSLSYAAILSPAPLSVGMGLPSPALSISGMIVGPGTVAIPILLPTPSLFQGLLPSGGILYDMVEIIASVSFENAETVASVPFDDVEMAQSF